MARNSLKNRIAGYRAEYKKKLEKIAGVKNRNEYNKLTKSEQEITEKKYKKKFSNELIQPENVNDQKKLEDLLTQNIKLKNIKQDMNTALEGNIIDSAINNSGKSSFFIIQIGKYGSKDFNKNIYGHQDWWRNPRDHSHGKIKPGDYLLFYFTSTAKIKEGYKKTLKVFCRVTSTSNNHNTIKFERLGELKGISFDTINSLKKILDRRKINYSFKNLARESFNVFESTKEEFQLLSDIDKYFKNIFLCSIQSNKAYEHFEKTILNPQNPSNLNVKIEMKKFSKISIWGLQNTDNNLNYWNQIQKGDLVLFYRDDHYFYSGIIEDKEKNLKLAKSQWGVDDKNRTWELIIYILPETQSSDKVKKEKVNELLEYEPGYRPFNNAPFHKVDQEKTLGMMLR